MPRKGSKKAADYDPLDDVVIVNCARCRRALLAKGQRPLGDLTEYVEGRVYGRPHCWRCISYARKEPLPPANRFHIPAQE